MNPLLWYTLREPPSRTAWDDERQEIMARDYRWARRAVGRNAVTVGDIAACLHLGRHQARHILITSGVPARLLTRKWRAPGGRWWMRTVWSAPPEALRVIWLEYWHRRHAREARRVGLSPKNRVDTFWRQQLVQARQLLDQRLLSDKRWTEKKPE